MLILTYSWNKYRYNKCIYIINYCNSWRSYISHRNTYVLLTFIRFTKLSVSVNRCIKHPVIICLSAPTVELFTTTQPLSNSCITCLVTLVIGSFHQTPYFTKEWYFLGAEALVLSGVLADGDNVHALSTVLSNIMVWWLQTAPSADFVQGCFKL